VHEIKSRLFTPRQKSIASIEGLVDRLDSCEICGGRIDIEGSIQYDHIVRHRNGGSTSIDNLRYTHPFCNNRRDEIEYIHQATDITLPKVRYLGDPDAPKQLKLFTDSFFES
jgi:5-methylcytosine-specific restriction endonuclease McrA